VHLSHTNQIAHQMQLAFGQLLVVNVL
jgi:hypothetical protein